MGNFISINLIIIVSQSCSIAGRLTCKILSPKWDEIHDDYYGSFIFRFSGSAWAL